MRSDRATVEPTSAAVESDSAAGGATDSTAAFV